MKRIAVCIPTHEGAVEYVKEAFQAGIHKLYKKYNLDIYYYDSSSSDEMEKIVAFEKESGADNLHYVKMSEYTFLDTKLERMYRGDDLQCKYDYIWPCKASSWAEECTIKRIVECVEKDYDIIVLNPMNKDEGYYPSDGEKEYSDINSFFQDMCGYLTGMVFRIIKRNTVLANVDWDMIYDKYRVWVPNGTFYEIGLIFEQLSRIDKFYSIVLCKDIIIDSSVMKGSNSHWRGEELSVWGECWPDTISKLPDVYEKKTAVIKSKHHLSNINVLKALRRRGKLNIIAFFRLFRIWNDISSISRLRLFLISIEPRMIEAISLLRDELYKKKLLKIYRKQYRKIEEQKKQGKKIAIYGAGDIGGRIAGFLENDGIDIECFAVTKQIVKAKRYGRTVVQIDDLIPDKQDLFIIVSVIPRTQRIIKKTLIEKGFKNYICIR